MLVDTATLYYRAFYGMPESVRAPDGTPVNAVRGTCDALAVLLREHRPQRFAACWDEDWRPAFRVAALPSYKAHRVGPDGGEDAPAALGPQVPVLAAVLAAVGLPRVGAAGHEADDVVATLTTRAVAAGRGVDVVTGDRDLFQLVDDDAGVRVLYTGRGVKNLQVVDGAALRARHGVRDGSGYADLAVLRGDPSDGLPGVPGIGERTAAALLARHGDLAAVLAAADDPAGDVPPAQRRRLRDAAGYLAAAPAVVRCVRDAPVDGTDEPLPPSPADPPALDALAERWGLRSSVDRLLGALAS